MAATDDPGSNTAWEIEKRREAICQNIGKVISSALSKKNMTVRELAEKAQVKITTVKYLRLGKDCNCEVSDLYKVAKVLELDPIAMKNGEEQVLKLVSRTVTLVALSGQKCNYTFEEDEKKPFRGNVIYTSNTDRMFVRNLQPSASTDSLESFHETDSLRISAIHEMYLFEE